MKTIFITGTATGIGNATVEHFAQQGWKVAATVRKPEQLEIFKHLPTVKTYLLDVTNFAQVESVTRAIIEEFGIVDAIVNNAGYAQYGPLESSSMEQIKTQYETNYFGLIAVCKAFIPHFRTNRSGTIINIASLSAKMGFPIFSVYSSSKAAVAVLSEGLAIELDPFNIKVKAVFPGTHATQIFSKMDAGLNGAYQEYVPHITNFIAAQQGVPKVSAPDNIAQVVWKAVTDNSQKYEYVGGRDAHFLIGLKRWLPQISWKQMQVGTLTSPPSPMTLSFLSWVMQGKKAVQTKIEQRFLQKSAK